MLILTRNVGESVNIGDSITIEVVRVIGERNVKLGVQAPADVSVCRGPLKAGKKPPPGRTGS